MEEALVDALRHPSVQVVKTEGLALEQAGPILREVVFHTVAGLTHQLPKTPTARGIEVCRVKPADDFFLSAV